MANKNPSDDVYFTPAQLAYLEYQFPDIIQPTTASEATLRHYFGQRSVIYKIREKTRGLAKSITAVGINDIPAPR